jgi:hypothetical protein
MGIEDYMLLKMAADAIPQMRVAGRSAVAETYRQRLDDLVKAVLTTPADRRGFRQKHRELLALVTEAVSAAHAQPVK